jgi:hypothetical protein
MVTAFFFIDPFSGSNAPSASRIAPNDFKSHPPQQYRNPTSALPGLSTTITPLPLAALDKPSTLL